MITEIDYSILFWIQNHIVCDALTPLMTLITKSGTSCAIWIALGLALLLFKKTRPAGVAVLISLIVTAVLNNYILKPVFVRPRPFHGVDIDLLIAAPGGFSFPSGHASSSFAAATAVFLKNKKAGIPAFIYAFLVGFSRNYFFVHFPSDVLCGALEGILCAVLVTALCDYLTKKVSSNSGRL